MSIIIDVETTGLGITTSRVVSIAWIVLSSTNTNLHEETHIIKGDFEIPYASTRIHGIDASMCQKYGKSFKDYVIPCLRKTFERFPEISTLVAHNLRFDKNMLLKELGIARENRLRLRFKRMQEFCTMRASTHYIKTSRYVSLSKAYKQICGIEMSKERSHTAEYDTYCCAEIYKVLATKH